MIALHIEDEGAGALIASIPWLATCLRHAGEIPTDDALHPVTDGIAVKRVHYQTFPVSKCRFDTHRNQVDVLVGVQGGEKIHLAHRALLTPSSEWNEREDVIFYQPPAEIQESTTIQPGRIVVLFPTDSHRCGTLDGVHPEITKLVFKVDRKLWGSTLGI
ncbi:MAG: YhcH/YjgK/YiaL family protein [Verrucomicrobiales bacterium]